MRGDAARLAHFLGRERVLVGITVAAALLRFATLGVQGYWYDETVTVSLLRQSLTGMLADLPESENTPPLYYVLAWFWAQLFGTGEVGLRALSALAGTATVPVAAAVGSLVSRRAAIVVALLAASSPLLVWYSQEARAYALLLLLTSLSALFFAQALVQPTTRAIAGWAVVSCLAVWTYYFAAPLLAAEAIVLIARYGLRRMRFPVGAVTAATMVLLPLAAYQASVGRASWIESLSLSLRVEEALRLLTIPAPAPLWAGSGSVEHETRSMWLIAAALLLVALVGLARWATTRERSAGLIAAFLATVTIGAPLALALLAKLLGTPGDVFLDRALLPAWLPLAILVAVGIAGRRTGVLGMTAVALLVASSTALGAATALDRDLQRDDWPRLAEALTATVIVVSPDHQAHALRYYRPELRYTGDYATAGDIDVLERGRSADVTVPPGFRVLETVQIQHWRLVRLRAPTRETVDAAAIPSERGAVLSTPMRVSAGR